MSNIETKTCSICNGRGTIDIDWEKATAMLVEQLSFSDEVEGMTDKELAAYVTTHIWAHVPLNHRLSFALSELIDRLEAK